MKHVSLIYRSSENSEAIKFIKNNLEDIFGEHITFTNCYLNDLADGQKLYADAFLAVDEYIYQQASAYIKDFNKIIKITRSPEREALKKISKIPAGTDVLIV